MSDIETRLKNPFPANAVHWRVGSTTKDKSKGTALAYLNARDVMKRLDEVVGMENWKDCYAETPSGRLICTLKLRIDGEWIGKTDGAGDTNVEGEKGAISDAFKRAEQLSGESEDTSTICLQNGLRLISIERYKIHLNCRSGLCQKTPQVKKAQT